MTDSNMSELVKNLTVALDHTTKLIEQAGGRMALAARQLVDYATTLEAELIMARHPGLQLYQATDGRYEFCGGEYWQCQTCTRMAGKPHVRAFLEVPCD